MMASGERRRLAATSDFRVTAKAKGLALPLELADTAERLVLKTTMELTTGFGEKTTVATTTTTGSRVVVAAAAAAAEFRFNCLFA